MTEVVCPTEGDTRSFGRRLAASLRGGDVILLRGDLGAGKTVLAGGIAEGLGVEERVTSPTFVLVRRYEGLVPFVHADVYRVASAGEIEDLDLRNEARDGVLVVEWGDVAEQQFGEHHLVIEIVADEDGARTIRLRPSGEWAGRPLEALA